MSVPPPSAAILARLAEISQRVEAHRAGLFLLEQERLALYNELRASGWVPPDPVTKSG
jgi:hypothetical protein